MPHRNARVLVALLACGLFLLLLIRTAWVGDDAYLTFRTIDNLVHGHGLRWNVTERVQAYTHPLWMLLVAGAYAVTREPFFTSIVISAVCSLAAVSLVVARLSVSTATAVLAAVVLLFSRAFVDYSTSGLETPLSYLLLAVFLAVYVRPDPTVRRLMMLSAIAALLGTTHLDLMLMVLPAVVVRAWRLRTSRPWPALAAGFSPFIAWELFSLVYYGFPFPNTVYAKLLGTDIPLHSMVRQGLRYVGDSLVHDPITLTAVAAACVTMRWQSRAAGVTWPPIVAGLALHACLVIRAGGDFMSGRLFTGPLLVSAVMLGRLDVRALPAGALAGLTAVCVALGVLSPRPTFTASLPPDFRSLISGSGIADERLFYMPTNSLRSVLRDGRVTSRVTLDDPHAPFIEEGTVGLVGYEAGPRTHVLDRVGLGDPLLARLPAIGGSRVGHYYREIPDGYRETLKTGTNQIVDPHVHAYYDRLMTITRGKIFSWERFRTIAALNVGW